MAVTATGPQGLAATGLITMVSESSTFQSRTLAGNASGALASIYYPYTEKATAAKRPFAIITAKGRRGERQSNDTNTEGGTLELILSDSARYEDEKDADLDFRNFIDGVITDLWALSRTGGYVTIQGIEEIEPAGSSDPRNDLDKGTGKPYHKATFQIDWAPYQG